MRFTLSTTKGLALLLSAGACALHAEVSVSFFRQPGAPLDPSIRNELYHAVDLASDWLTRHQNEDGSWGAPTGRVERTAIVQLALAGGSATMPDGAARAAVWLDQHLPDAHDRADAHAWRLIALLTAAREPDSRAALAQRLLHEARPHAPAQDATWQQVLLWQEAYALAGEAVAPTPGAAAAGRLKALAEGWPFPDKTFPDALWPDVHLINRFGSGALVRDGAPLDWRSDVARMVINSQRRAPAGGGFWGPDDLDGRIWQTAFALLVLLEL